MKKTLIIIIILIIIFLAIDYFYLKKFLFKNENENENNFSNDQKNNNTKNLLQTKIYNKDANFPLKFGSKGDNVKYMQAILNIYKGTNLDLDGDFGTKTEKALYDNYNIKAVPKDYYKHFVTPYINEAKRYYELRGVIL